jgi:glycosyltransferase involved in cell wall biosynthesis
VRTMALFADSFRANNVRARYRNRRLANALNHPVVEWVANHNLNACQSLQEIGVDGNKIVPWDWMPAATPDQFEPKFLPFGQEPLTLFYAGSLTEEKGVGDLLRALAELKGRGVNASVQLAGKGDESRFKVLAVKLGIADRTFFLGLVPNHAVIELMRQADAVVIPSRHNYPEALPMTIYEAFCSRTPIVASDHPMFRVKLLHQTNALIFRAGKAEDLAAKLELLFSNAELYARLSQSALESWTKLQIPVKFGELLRRWVRDWEEDRDWIRSYRLAPGRYPAK